MKSSKIPTLTSSMRQWAILNQIEIRGSLPVNRKWCLNLNKDPDLTVLLKRGDISRTRNMNAGPRTGTTFVVITEKGKKRLKLIPELPTDNLLFSDSI